MLYIFFSILIASYILLDMLVYWDGLLFIYTDIHINILRTKNIAFGTEITYFDCSFHCDIPLNLKTIIPEEVKLMAITCSAFGL